MECGDLQRTGVSGLERFFVINIDHHPGQYRLRTDQLVRSERRRLRGDGVRPRSRAGRAADENHCHAHLPGDPHRHRIVPLLEHLAENVRHLPEVPGSRSRPGAGRAQRLRQQQHGPAEAVRRGPGRDANRSDAAASRSSTSITRWRASPAAPTRTPRDSINLPLTVKEIEAVVFFKQEKGDRVRVSLRSKGDVDIGEIAKEYGGGGHKNASGCTVERARSKSCRRRSSERSRAPSMDGLLIVDKPSGPTSHDVVARIRRVLREKRIGHTGTLDPMATGVLVLVVGKATRLAKFLSASDKSYDAIVRLGFATDTERCPGAAGGAGHRWRARRRAKPSTPRSTRFAAPSCSSRPRFQRRRLTGIGATSWRDVPAPFLPACLPHSCPSCPHNRHDTSRSTFVRVDADTVALRVDCSAGFYIRSLGARPGPAAGRRRASRGAASDPERRLRTRSGAAARRGGTGSGGRGICARAAERRARLVAVRGPDRRRAPPGRSRPGRQADRP